MKFECDICSGTIEAPDDFSDAHILCPNCGREIVVPHLDLEFGVDERPGLDPEAYTEPLPAAPTTPDQFRAQMEVQHTRSKLTMGLVFAGILLAIAAIFLYFVPPAAILEFTSGVSEKKTREKLYASTGLAPLGHYRSDLLPGLRGETEEGRGIPIRDKGTVFLVVDTAAAPRYFPPTDEGYKRIVAEAERYKVMDPKRKAPPRERCRFDPKKFQLIVKGAPAVRGELISINYGEYKGFYSAFSYVAPEDSPAAGEKEHQNEIDDAMRLSVAFVVPSAGINPEELWIQLDGLNALKVPAVDSRLVVLPR